MPRRIRSRTKVRHLKPIFSTDNPELGALIARLSVLYEDLRIEVAGATREDIEHFDGNSSIYRKLYFLRRSTITLTEFRGTLQRLNDNAAFNAIRKTLDPEAERRWLSANDFFGKNHELLKSVRNDCGGHFRLATAQAVVSDRLDDDSIGMMEINFGPTGEDATVFLRFAHDLVASSLVLTKTGPEDLREFANRLFSVIRDGWEHVVRVIHVITRLFLVPAFGL